MIHREIYCRLEIKGKVIRAGQFMSYIERFSLGHKLDRCLLESLKSNNLLNVNSEPIAVSLLRESIMNPDFRLWLTSYIVEISDPEKLHFEMSKASITLAGSNSGVDNCGMQMGVLAYLYQLKPHDIKLDMSLSCYNNEGSEENQQKLELRAHW